MAGKYKAKITAEQFDSFMAYCNEDKERVKGMLKDAGELFGYHSNFYDAAKKMFDLHFMSSGNRKYTFSLENSYNMDLKTIVDYIASNGTAWDVVQKEGRYLHLSFSGTSMLWLEGFCMLEEMADYDGFTMSEIWGRIGDSGIGSMLPVEMGAVSIRDMKEKKSRLEEKEAELNKKKDDISYARTVELVKMEEEIQKMKDALYKRKQELLTELDKKLGNMNKEINEIKKQIFMMESEIYTIRSYTGETVELKKIRSGRKADPATPLIINQKLMYLDEDLARIVGIYQKEIAMEYTMFADAVAADDDVFESFCPQERCLTFFRLSRNANYPSYNGKRHMYETEQLIHGKKMGFLLRDMECAYVGWLDESWNTDSKGKPVFVTFEENLMYQPKTVDIHEVSGTGDKEFMDDQNTMLSRLFAMAVVQGILDNKGLLEFPEKVSITKPGLYLSYNFATGWLMDDRFGDFAILVDNLNKRTKVKDQILICKSKTYGLQGRGEADRTYDCEVERGVNKVNFLESDDYGRCTIYVSAKKRYSLKGATANVLCQPREYINITYMNSIWMNYYIQTKKLGDYVEDYAEMVKHFKSAVEVIVAREQEEMGKIKQYYPDADKINEWQVLLSHWKLNHNIRFINNYQAKRIATYLEAGNYKENAHLFEQEKYYNHIDETDGGIYSHTIFEQRYIHQKEGVGNFANGSSYHKQSFYLEGYKDCEHWTANRREEQEEKNACVITKGIPKLEAAVPERVALDKEKLLLVGGYVSEFLSSHNIEARELEAYARHNGLVYSTDRIGFVTLETIDADVKENFFKEAEDRYPIYIMQSECWKVAYYDYIHWQYAEVLNDAKRILHGRHINGTKKVQCAGRK